MSPLAQVVQTSSAHDQASGADSSSCLLAYLFDRVGRLESAFRRLARKRQLLEGCAFAAAAAGSRAETSPVFDRTRGRRGKFRHPPCIGRLETRNSMHGLPPRTPRAYLAAACPIPAVDLQQRPEPRLPQLDRPAARLLPAAMDDARLRRLLGLGPRAPCNRVRVVLRDPGVPDRPQLVRRRTPSPVRPRVRLTTTPATDAAGCSGDKQPRPALQAFPWDSVESLARAG
jgi:hypothetical protein